MFQQVKNVKFQIYHKSTILKLKKKKTEKLQPLFCRNQSTLLQLLHYVEKSKTIC